MELSTWNSSRIISNNGGDGIRDNTKVNNKDGTKKFFKIKKFK